MSKALFITLEGIEGCGKSVQLGLLETALGTRNIPFVSTCEPGGTAFGREVRKILLRQDGVGREPIAELMLYLADRYQHLKEVIEPSLSQGLHVLSDRYHDATLAYQGYARGIGLARIERLARVLELRPPDLTLVLDIDVETGLRRARARNAQHSQEAWGRFESEETDFHRRVREGYRLLAEGDPQRIHLIDGSGSPQEVFSRLLPVLYEKEVFA
ncbi:MAG: dTMP kinase [Acidobacteriota bacterium]